MNFLTKHTAITYSVALLGIIILINSKSVFAQQSRIEALMNYCESLKKNSGAYGWWDQHDAHITPNYAVIGILFHLNKLPETKTPLINWTESHHPQTGLNIEAGPSGSEMRDILYQQIQTISWLGGNIEKYKPSVSKWKSQRTSIANYEETKFGNLWQETFTPITFSLLNLPTHSIEREFINYLDSLRRPNGSYNNSFLSFGKSDGNILYTVNAVLALNALKQDIPLKKELITWLQNCQDTTGGFTHQPHPTLAKQPDIIYTWAGIKLLRILGTQPLDIKGCLRYIMSLQNADGGFGNKPGLESTPMSSFYAVEALKDLGALNMLQERFSTPPIRNKQQADFSEKKVFTVQFQSVGNGSIHEAVMLADLLKIDLWGAKNAPQGWIEEAQRIADERNVKVHFFIADEPYNKNVIVPGIGVFGHILDYFAPAHYPVNFPTESTWADLREKYFKPLLQQGGGLILQVCNNEPLARILLDESIDNGGYTALATHHFDQNFAFWLPYLFDYKNRLPMICLQDGHGTESWWWNNYLFKERTLFIAKEPSYASMIEAVKRNHIISIKHDSLTQHQTRIMGSTQDVRDFILAQSSQWKWWNDQGINYDLPWAAITILKPNDKFEKEVPEKGINIRVRCWYKTRQQFLLNPITQLVGLKLNGQEIKVEHKLEHNNRKQTTDAYYIATLPDLPPGEYTVEAVLNKIDTHDIKIITSVFRVD